MRYDSQSSALEVTLGGMILTADPLLRVDNVVKSYSGVPAIDGLSFEVQELEIVGIVGPNGAGKTTIINIITGMQNLDSGSVYFKGERIDTLRTPEIVRRGIARSFQIPKPFKKMTVTENLAVPMITLHSEVDHGKIQRILEILSLNSVANELARNISVGQQKLLEIGRILALDPKLLMLDEPTAGVHPDLRRMIVQILQEIYIVGGRTVLIVSHDLNFIKQLCQRVVVMNAGKKLIEGDLSVLQDPLVVEAYLGRR